MKNHSGNINDISIFGQEDNPTTRKLALMNLAIRSIEANLGDYNADTLGNDLHKTLKADFILANPPFNSSDWGGERLKDDVRWAYGTPPTSNANYAWIQHMLHHTSPNGRIGFVMANGTLSTKQGGEDKIRENIIKSDLVEGIIAMPTQLFYGVAIPCCVWFLSKSKKQKGKTLFIDARKLGTMVTRSHKELTKDDINKITKTYRDFEAGTLTDIQGFCNVATIEDIEKQDYILTPGRYVGIEEQETDSEPFEEKMARLTTTLSDLFKEGHSLEQEIKTRLGAIGYEV